MMTLRVVHGSPNCRKALAVVHQLGLDVDIRGLDFMAGDLRTPEFLALNPNGMVPVLTDGDFALWESNAIMQYLCDKKPGNTLLPEDPQTRADITRWQFWAQAHLHRATETFIFEKFVKPRFLGGAPDAAKLEEGRESFHRFAPVLDRHLQSHELVVGDHVTIADFAIATPLAFAETVNLPWQPYTHIQAWYARLDKMPAWQKSAPPAGAIG